MKNSFVHSNKGGTNIRILRHAGLAIVGIIFAAFIALIFGVFVMLLWNWLMPPIFGLGEITYWQAFGLVILARLLIGTVGHHRPPHDRHHRKRFDEWINNGNWKGLVKSKNNLNGWDHYDEFWKEEGEEAFRNYIERKNQGDNK